MKILLIYLRCAQFPARYLRYAQFPSAAGRLFKNKKARKHYLPGFIFDGYSLRLGSPHFGNDLLDFRDHSLQHSLDAGFKRHR